MTVLSCGGDVPGQEFLLRFGLGLMQGDADALAVREESRAQAAGRVVGAARGGDVHLSRLPRAPRAVRCF